MTAAPSVETYPSAYGPTLLLQHAKLLADSAISVEVAQARKYTSVERKAKLEQYGFSRSQRLVPTLLIPIYDAFGEHALYQHRPDEPRIRDGKRLKYETCFGSKLVVDVPPLVRDDLRNPKLPLVIRESALPGLSLHPCLSFRHSRATLGCRVRRLAARTLVSAHS